MFKAIGTECFQDAVVRVASRAQNYIYSFLGFIMQLCKCVELIILLGTLPVGVVALLS